MRRIIRWTVGGIAVSAVVALGLAIFVYANRFVPPQAQDRAR